MAESIFGEKAVKPEDSELARALGAAMPLWEHMAQQPNATCEWKFYTKAAGWTQVVKLGKRTLFYMLPKEEHFKLTFVFGERAVEAAKNAGLPAAVLNALLQARAYMEGRGVSMDVRGQNDLATAEKLLQIKLAN